jgi:hypothetical protein
MRSPEFAQESRRFNRETNDNRSSTELAARAGLRTGQCNGKPTPDAVLHAAFRAAKLRSYSKQEFELPQQVPPRMQPTPARRRKGAEFAQRASSSLFFASPLHLCAFAVASDSSTLEARSGRSIFPAIYK